MRTSLWFSAVIAALVTEAAADVLPAKSQGPSPKVPIGFSKAPFAKTRGRLFELDGHVGYFAGPASPKSPLSGEYMAN
jgi:hypothetical protein